jgi:hypothetical protein
MSKLLRDELESLPKHLRHRLFRRLWLNLTIAGRSIWSNPDLTDADKLNALKWLNEIQHRVWNAHELDNLSIEVFVDLVSDHVMRAQAIRGDVGWCFRDAIDHVKEARKA